MASSLSLQDPEWRVGAPISKYPGPRIHNGADQSSKWNEGEITRLSLFLIHNKYMAVGKNNSECHLYKSPNSPLKEVTMSGSWVSRTILSAVNVLMMPENVPVWHRAMYRRGGIWICKYVHYELVSMR